MVDRLPIQPHLLYEACKIMSIAPSDFINITLPHTLPAVCGNCDRTVLDLIAKEVPQFSKVLVNHLPAILAHIFLLPSQPATTRALTFLVQVIGNDMTESLIRSIVKVNVYSLLAALVVKMGDDDPRMAERVSSTSRNLLSCITNQPLQGP